MKFQIALKKQLHQQLNQLVGSQNIDVIFGDTNNKTKNKSISLPVIKKISKNEFIRTRAIADSEALKLKFSDEKIFKSYEPEGNISKILYKIAEKIRYENIGSNYFKGIKNNLNQFYKIKANQNVDYKNSDFEFIDAFECYLRSHLSRIKDDQIEIKFSKFKKNQTPN